MGLRRVSALVLFAAASYPAGAQNLNATNGPLYAALGAPEGWTITGSVRARIEGIDGQFRPALNRNDALLSFQTTLFAQYATGGFRVGGELIDSRGYLERHTSSISTTEVNAVELGQAYIAYDAGAVLGGESAVLTLGRQIFNDGSRRLIARNQYRNTINAFTGARLDWADRAGDKVRMFWLMPHTRLPMDAEGIRDNRVAWDRESPDLQFYGGSITVAHALGGTFETYAYQLTERDAPGFQTRNRRLLTPGARLFRGPKRKAWDWDVEADYQTGHVRGSTAATDLRDLRVSAYFVHAEVGRTFDLAWKPRLSLAYDRASGDRRAPNSYNRFDTLFGARRWEYGPTSFYGPVQRSNLSSPQLHLDTQPSKRLDTLLAWRPLWLVTAADSFGATGVRDPSGRSGKFAGHQIEGRVRYWLLPERVRLDTGVAVLLRGRFLRDAPNAADAGDTRYGYADVTFSF